MDCSDATEQLGLLAAGDLPGDLRARLLEHAEGCPECSAALEDYRALIGRLKSPAGRQDARPLVAAILAAANDELAAERQAARRRRRLAWLAGASAAAAALLLGVGIRQSTIRSQPADPIASITWPAIRPDAPAHVQVSLEELWQHAAVRSAPVSDASAAAVHGQHVYVLLNGDRPPRVAALDAKAGDVVWQSDVQSIGYLSADDQNVYCLAAAGAGLTELVALDAGSGTARWRFVQEDRTRIISPTRAISVAPGRLCWTTSTAVHMIDPATGQPLWTRQIPQKGVLSSVAVDGRTLYVASADELCRLSPDNGEVLWRQPLGGANSKVSRPLVQAAAGRAFVASRQRDGRGRVVCIDAETHRVLWSQASPAPFHLLAAEGRLYLREQGVVAMDASTGKPLWTWQAKGCGPVTVHEGVIYFVDAAEQGRLIALDSRNGSEVWESAGIRSCEAFLFDQQAAYLKTPDGVLRAVSFQGPS